MLFLSLGENCLCQNIINRYKLNTFNTIYSYAKSNIEYALYLESNNYYKFLDNDNLTLKDNSNIYISQQIAQNDNIFIHSGFEFTHHDVVNNKDHLNSFIRKIYRMDRIRYNEDICFFYYFRNTKLCHVDRVKDDLIKFGRLYKRDNNIYFILLHQNLISPQEQRKVVIHKGNNIFDCCFHTLTYWGGNDTRAFYAVDDDKLIDKALQFIKHEIM